MTIQSKQTLKDYFNTGEVITQQHLHDQIDTFSSIPFSYTARTTPDTWTQQTNSGSRTWRSITSSSDGTKLAAGVLVGGYIYTSTDSGATWTEHTNSGSRNWYAITSSSDGTKLAAGVNGGYIYTLTFESPKNIILPSRDTWLYDMHLLSVEDTYSVSRWHFKFAVQNTGAIMALVGQIQGDSADFDEGDVITANYTEFNGLLRIYTSQPDTLLIQVENSDGLPVDWSASGTVVKISKPASSGSSGSS